MLKKVLQLILSGCLKATKVKTIVGKKDLQESSSLFSFHPLFISVFFEYLNK